MKKTSGHQKRELESADEAFKDFIATLRPDLKLWSYFVNWDKVFRNTKEFEYSLNLLNSLLGKDDFEKRFDELLSAYPEVVSAIPTLVVRDGAKSTSYSVIQDIDDLRAPVLEFDFAKPATSVESRQAALRFVNQSGLRRIFEADGVKNLVDFVLGVEAGLDSNGRKNRSGTSMETVVEGYLRSFCRERELSYVSQATPEKIRSEFGFEVPVDKAERRFDFAISDGRRLVLVEVNFYGGGGSKLKATAGEYKGLHDLLSSNGFEFVWVTDGNGWKTTLRPLREAFDHVDYVWNLDWLGSDFMVDLFPAD